MATRLPSSVETERLVLRRWRVEDIPALTRAITDSLEHLRPWMPWIADEPLSHEQRRDLIHEWTEHWEDGSDSVLGTFHDGHVIGGAGLHRRVGPGAVEIGYWIHVAQTGNGYATEAARGLVTAAFGLDDIDSVEIHHDRANLASRRVPEKLGFVLKTEEPRDPEAPGETGVEVQWEMTRESWNKGTTQTLD